MKNFLLTALALIVIATILDVSFMLVLLAANGIASAFGPNAGLISLLPLTVIMGIGLGHAVAAVRREADEGERS